ncbi:CHAT domain-containing protein [soil metagenome]
MPSNYPVVVLLLLLAGPVCAQSVTQVDSETQLASALCSAKDTFRQEALIKKNSKLINSHLWRTLLDRAARAYYDQSPEAALSIYYLAIRVAKDLNQPRLIASTYYNVGRTYSGLNEFRKSIEAYENSRQFFSEAGLDRDLIYVLADLGTFFYVIEDYEKAKTYSEQSLNLAYKVKSTDVPAGAWPDEFGQATALQTLAEIDLRDGLHTEAIAKLQRSLEMYTQLNGAGSSYDRDIAGVYAALGRVYPEMGNYAHALLYLNKALAIVKRLSDQNMLASLLNSFGYLYMEQEDYAQAKAQFERSLKIHRALNNAREEARVTLNLGVIEQRRGNYDEALQHFKVSQQTARAMQNIDTQIAAGEGIGVVLTAKRDFSGALTALDESYGLAKNMRDKTRQTELLWRKAQTEYDMGNYSRSATFAESAVDLARVARLPKLTYLATTTLGQAYAAQKKLELATKTLKDATDLVEGMRDQVGGSEIESQLFLENKVASYHSLVDLFIKQNKPLEALLFAERAKGRVLLDVLSGGKADLARLLTRAEKAEIQRLNRKISEINGRIKIGETVDSSLLDSLYRELDAARLEYQSFQDALYVAHPDFRIRTGRTAALTSKDINHLTLNKDCAYLEYVVSKEQIYLFVLTTKSTGDGPELKVYPLAIKPDDLAQKVSQFHQRLANRHPDFRSLARELYATLIEPIAQQLRGIRTICIVPDGFLWNLPFQALMTGSNHYLIEDHSLYYAHSLSVLREMTKERVAKEKREASLIAFGNPVIGKDEQSNEELCPLPEAETEVTSVAKTFGLASNKVFIGTEASEKTFRRLAPTYATIHLATHGVLDNRQPLYSHLLLTKTEGDPENDGLLEAREIMNLDLRADLAVLSACETANGKIAPGEGVMGMSWAFFVAGSRSMLVSQWKVNSASTSEVMVNFYQALKSEENHSCGKKASALRKTALKTMKDPRYRHPFYWAGFVMIGDGN